MERERVTRDEALLTGLATGGGKVVVVVVVVVVGGLGFSLQHCFGSVELAILEGQQKLPYPRSRQLMSLTQGSFRSWSKYSSAQQYCPLQHWRCGPSLQSSLPFSLQSKMGSIHSPRWICLRSWWRKHSRSPGQSSLDLQVAFLFAWSNLESSLHG